MLTTKTIRNTKNNENAHSPAWFRIQETTTYAMLFCTFLFEKKNILCFLLILDTYTPTPILITTTTIKSVQYFNSISYIGWEYIHFFYKSLWRIQLKYLNALNDFVISYVSKCFVLIKFQPMFFSFNLLYFSNFKLNTMNSKYFKTTKTTL